MQSKPADIDQTTWHRLVLSGSPLTPLTLWSVFSVECLLANA